VKKVKIRGKRAIVGILLTVGLILSFASGPSDCKQAAQPVIDALERYHQINGQYPVTLDKLVQAKLLRALPHPTWNVGVQHMNDFEYWVEQDLDYYCLAYAEAPIFGGIGPPHWDEVSYVSFRSAWDDSPGVPKCDLFGLPLDRAGDLFQRSRSSKDLRKFIEIAAHQKNQDSWPLYSEDVTQAVGNVSPCTMDGRAGFDVEAGDDEAAAFRFITNPAPAAFMRKHEVILILERDREGTKVRWHEVYRANSGASAES
jgi:hypothetical protein